MTTKTDRTQQLITGILNDRQFINNQYSNAQDSIKNYLQRFFNAESTNGIMDISDLRRNISSNDLYIWREILDQYENKLANDDEGSRALNKAKQTAGTDKQSLLNAICAVVIASTSLGVASYLHGSLINEYQYAMNFQEREARTAGHKGSQQYSNAQIEQQANDLFNQNNYGLTVNQRVWIKNDKLTSQSNNAVNKGLMKGIDQNYMANHLFKNFGTSQDSLTTIFNHTKNFYNNQLINQEKTRFGSVASNDVYDRFNVNLLDWNLASTHSHTDACDVLADGSPYRRSDYPPRPHWGCICFSSPHY